MIVPITPLIDAITSTRSSVVCPARSRSQSGYERPSPLVPARTVPAGIAARPRRALLEAGLREVAGEVEVRRARRALVVVVRTVLVFVDQLRAATKNDAERLGVIVVLHRMLDEALHAKPLVSSDVPVEAEKVTEAARRGA